MYPGLWGAPFLLAYGLTFFITAILSFIIPKPTAALIAMFQGGAALPLAFWLERRLGTKRMAPDNPLRQVSGQMAASQSLGLPALIVVYSLNPDAVPAVLAALGGMHFLPYAWLHRTRVYLALSIAVSFGSLVLQLVLRADAISYILLYIAVIYWITAPLVYRNAAILVKAQAV